MTGLQHSQVAVHTTAIPDLLIIDQVIEQDGRGWTKTVIQRDQLVELGFPSDFNVNGEKTSSVRHRGFTRGIHADTVSKLVGLNNGEVYAAFVDLRKGPSFGRVITVRMTIEVGVFVPRGCGNSYQALTDDVQYIYLEERRTSTAPSTRLSLSDPALGIEWPIPLNDAILLPDDVDEPLLRDVVPIG